MVGFSFAQKNLTTEVARLVNEEQMATKTILQTLFVSTEYIPMSVDIYDLETTNHKKVVREPR